MEGLLAAGCGLFGLLIGSFLNVVIWRVPRGESIVSPPSHCPGCDTEIAPYDNIPVLSWLVLRGRCRHCGTRISVRYPLVELASAGLWVAMALRFGWSWELPAYLVLVSALLALSLIDLDTFLLPNKIVYPLAVRAGRPVRARRADRRHGRRLRARAARRRGCVHVLRHRAPDLAARDGLRRREAELLPRRRARVDLVGLGVPRALPRVPARRGGRGSRSSRRGSRVDATTSRSVRSSPRGPCSRSSSGQVLLDLYAGYLRAFSRPILESRSSVVASVDDC